MPMWPQEDVNHQLSSLMVPVLTIAVAPSSLTATAEHVMLVLLTAKTV